VPFFLASCSFIQKIKFTDPVEEIRKIAESGDARAQLYLAHILDEGAGLPRDGRSAVEWYRKSASQGEPRALYELARLTLSGSVGQGNDAEAVRLLFKAGEAGHAKAQVLLGGMYLTGKGKQEFASQVRHYRKGAEQKQPKALYVMGWIFHEGAGLPRSQSEAKKLLTRSDELGNTLSARVLGDISLTESSSAEKSTALHWYEKGAQHGDLVAFLRLLSLPQSGATVPSSEHKLDDIDHGFLDLQNTLIAREEEQDVNLALLAAQRLMEIDPGDSKGRKFLGRLSKATASRSSALLAMAGTAIDKGHKDEFRNTLGKLLLTEFDELQLSRLLARYWERSDDTVRSAEKSGAELLRSLDALDNMESIKKNPAKIHRQISLFRETLDRGLKERPGDQELLTMQHRGEKLIADINKKLDELKDTDGEATTAELNRGRSLLDNGKFDSAAKVFEKLARTPGFTGIAMAYVYLGITNLARINSSKVVEAKKLRLKGFSSFQNALRFDRMVTLPSGYEKFRDVFDEAKKLLK
jgi:TPR repeat protein